MLAGIRVDRGTSRSVHAIDAEAKAFYRYFGFEECAVDDLHLMLLIKDIPTPA